MPSFAEAYRATFARDRLSRSYGRIACGGDPLAVVWGFHYFPIVRAYRPDNTLLWAALIEDFAQGLVYQHESTSPTVHPRSSPTEYTVAVQSVRRRTYLIDQETGNGGLVSDSLPRIAWIGDSTYVAAWSFPYPRVEVRVMPDMEPPHAAAEPR